MKKFIQAVLSGILISGCSTGISETEIYNVLFISIDDLRPELGCYGVDYVKSPAIDKLAEGGTLFTNAFCQLSHCAPSRSSLMTGLRPEECGVLDLKTHFREKLPEVVTLPQFFKNNGYQCTAFGKVYHNDPVLQDSLSWTKKCWVPPVEEPIYAYALPGNIKRQQSGKDVRSYPTEAADVPDNYYPDGMITDKVIEELHQLKNSGKPFFIAAGFYKPHLPFNAPKKYWDLYQPGEIPLSDIHTSPEGAPEYLFRKWSEPGSYFGVNQEEPFSDSLQMQLKHGYLACVSYIDAQIHKIVQALNELDLNENTIIVIWGDHGFKLGEYGRWSKHSNLDVDTRVPLIIFHPGKTGKRENKLAELVDVYPTLVNLAGLPEVRHTNGVDLFAESAKGFAISQIEHDGFTGYSIRTSEFRYVAWFNKDKTEITFRELYDLGTGSMELKNLANEESMAGMTKELEEKLLANLDL